MVQLRDKDCPAEELLSLACELRRVTEGRALLIVNDRVDVALLSGADGVQLGEKALDAASARRLVGSEMLIGRSVHSVEGAAEAEADGADFLVLGTIFETASHPGADTGGLELVRDVTGMVGIPVIGIGGISESNMSPDLWSPGRRGRRLSRLFRWCRIRERPQRCCRRLCGWRASCHPHPSPLPEGEGIY